MLREFSNSVSSTTIGQIPLQIFHLSSHADSPPFHLYRQFSDTLYISNDISSPLGMAAICCITVSFQLFSTTFSLAPLLDHQITRSDQVIGLLSVDCQNLSYATVVAFLSPLNLCNFLFTDQLRLISSNDSSQKSKHFPPMSLLSLGESNSMIRITRDFTVTPSLELFARHLANLFKSEHLIETNELTFN